MKTHHPAIRFLAAGSLGFLITGCLFRPANVATRQFVLTPIPAVGQPAAQNQPAVGISPIKMPDYLLRSEMVLRKGANEIEYLENTLWAERLDRSFQHTLAANLATQLPGSQLQLSAWRNGEVALVATVVVERFDVDAQGKGTLVAHWRVESVARPQAMKSGECNLTLSGPAPFANPGAIATTLSELTAQFSEVLAQAIRECATLGAGAR